MKASIQRQFKALNGILRDGGWLAAAAAGFFLASCAVLIEGMALGLRFDDLAFVAELNWALFLCALIASTAALIALCALWQSPLPLSAVLPTGCFCFALLLASGAGGGNIYFSLGLCLPMYFAARWSFPEERFPFGRPKIPMWATWAAAGLMFAVFTLLMAYASILRYRTYNATNFDLGLFAQMFEQLRRTGHAWTTLERNRLLTHFGVHCSPVYYLLLPFYMLAPRVETLLCLQAAGVAAGVFAVRGIARELFGRSPRLIMAACLLYLLNPSMPQGCLFDFHENKFLAVFLLWAVYFMLRRKTAPLLVFSALTLSVKEDAAIYVAALALFLLFAQRWEGKRAAQALTGIGMAVMAVAWFAAAITVIRRYGAGEMVDRLRNFFPPGGGGGLLDVAKVCLSDLGYVIKTVFTQAKAEFLLWVLLPLGFAPFLARKGAAWLLMLPLLVINLLSDYGYQHAVGYQYTYGSVALAIVLALLALKECRPSLRRGALAFAVMASVACTVPLTGPRVSFYREVMRVNPERIAAVDKILGGLPMEAEITATTWFATHLYRHDRVYMYPNYYDAPRATQYLVCKPEEVVDNLELFIGENGYELVEEEAFVRVYVLGGGDMDGADERFE
ncbi:MAG: DUF2079 domain-containing protein [Oscillospiraceae bacterium]|jgi:uncharacterized membrane protein|nr:DUF2079 domain-containing protein [Oscillospiraceae bacterium]